jgi:DNA end-binding protein Ku
MRAMWSGSLSFGLINIPVKAYTASQEHEIQFHMLHKKDLSPIQFKRVCTEENKEVPYSDIVKGYEYEKGEYVVIEEDEFKQANLKKTSTMEIQYFADLSEIEIVFYEKPYYLEPDKKAAKAYQLLFEALNESKKVAIVNFVFHHKEHLGAVIASDGVLVLMQMRYQAEIRSTQELNIPQEKIAPKELKMALDLVNQLTSHFEPEKHFDTYTTEIQSLIESKLKGKKIPTKAKEPVKTHKVQDLMELLKESMKQKPEETKVKKSKGESKNKIHTLYSESKPKATKRRA